MNAMSGAGPEALALPQGLAIVANGQGHVDATSFSTADRGWAPVAVFIWVVLDDLHVVSGGKVVVGSGGPGDRFFRWLSPLSSMR
jgi:hypothetical protein